jgi:hypothetical protein
LDDVTNQLPDEELPTASVPPPVVLPEGQVAAEAAAASTAAVRSAKRRVLAFLGTFILVLLALLAIDILGNASALYPTSLRPSRSERAWKTRRFNDLVKSGQAPQVIILGSSRTMQIRPAYVAAITGKRVFNYGVSDAEPIDFLAILRHVLETGDKPQMLIVGMDDEAFGTRLKETQLQLASDWGLFHNLPTGEKLRIGGEAIANVNPKSVGKSVMSLLRRPRLPVLRKANTLMLDDGYLIYREKAILQAKRKYNVQAEAERQGRSFHRNEAEHLKGLTITPAKVELFRQFLALAKSNGIEVKVMMLPLQPTYEKATSTGSVRRLRDDVSRLVATECAAAGASYVDFRKLSDYGGDPMLFWDGVHQQPENVRRMINALFGLPPDNVVAKLPGDLELLDHLPKVTTLSTP